LICSTASLESRLRKPEKIEWWDDGSLKDSFKNFLKEMRSLIWLSSSESESVLALSCPVECEAYFSGVKPLLQQQAFK
jgi:hypothetical protein